MMPQMSTPPTLPSAPPVATSVARQLRVYGLVQGVYYRASMVAEAQRLGATGWVRNRSDGSVEALLCGTPEAIESLTEWAWLGPPAARVERVLSQDQPNAPPSEMTSGFELHPTF